MGEDELVEALHKCRLPQEDLEEFVFAAVKENERRFDGVAKVLNPYRGVLPTAPATGTSRASFAGILSWSRGPLLKLSAS